ncbi:multiheme c-type cytochrome [Nannocystis pusilla]|uniref:Multiheme c-type cytochrome n=1 Tax=Nannocystis pusilla TaxID=889268 RepID=A0A9X3ESA8_9BACT|nr:multiheme c-type cytochrome [Nannocystis pusilla]MCY1008469.1 multiheme c-type cytochrome [Nannocystis pusilla]
MKTLHTILTLVLFACGGGGSPSDSDEFLSDALSMPREPTVALDGFASAEQCGLCHEAHYREWSTSGHAYAMSDPVFRAFVAVRQEHYGGKQDMFCLQCHSPIGTRGGEIVPGFDFAELQPITLEGVTCESCHKVASLARPYNSGHVLEPGGPMRGTIAEPAVSAAHESSVRADVKRLLAGAARVDIATVATSVRAGDVVDLLVTVENNISGHNFPTGSTFNRQAWIEVVVRDGDDRIVFATGTLDASGEPRGSSRAGPGEGEILRLGSILVDARGEPVLFPWRATEHVSNALGPLGERVFRLRVPTTRAARGPLSAEARVLFRAFSPTALRALGLDEYVTRLEIHEVSRDRTSVELRPP